MTDKQIIDGVDVSGCPHYKTGDCLISPVWCDQFYNCDYKQLKRKEHRIVELNKTIKAKEQECEKLKQALQEIKEIAEEEIECKIYEVEHDCFNEIRCKAINEHIDFLKQILEKIKEVNNEHN